MREARIWEEAVVIPTYEAGAPDKNPMFLEKRVYQGSTGKIYPYPTTQVISRQKTDKTYQAVFLENEYLKVMILPELGGRIQRAYDKTNGYDFVYYNHVIKPALVGLLGPWISGGIEFNWPQHHRPTTFMPVDHTIRENGDGSKSLLIGDVDQIHGTKEITTFTIYPGRSYIEIRGQLYNGTPVPQTFLWWANPAVPVNDYTQSIFPPDVHNVYDHGKRAVSRFPVATGEYYKHDYSEGVDISRYRNIPVPTSYMAEKSNYDFVGGYDCKVQAGLLHVADHHVSTGKKQWTWGCGDFGKAWDRNLTDSDGPYIELMTGMFCDNQPDFTWLKPYEEKTFRQYFMPYKKVGQVKNATIFAVLGDELTSDGLRITVYGTSVYEGARVSVFYDGKHIFDEECRLSPNDIYQKTIPDSAFAGLAEGEKRPDFCRIKVTVTAKNGKELVSYQEKDPGIPEIGKPAPVPQEPSKVMTNEELYLIGQHIEQYRHATWLPDPYYLEGLKRDPGDVRINNSYGLLLLRRGLFSESEKHFLRAIKRLTYLQPSPYFGEPFYNLGLSLFYQEKFDKAYDAFYKATWTNEEQEMAFYYLAAIAVRKAKYEDALSFIDKALVKNLHNIKARALKGIILHKLGRDQESKSWLDENLRVDAFDFESLFVKALIEGENTTEMSRLAMLDRSFHETYLRISRDLMEAGLYQEACLWLDSFRGADKPLLHYYKGYALLKLGRDSQGMEEMKHAEELPACYTFPNKPEEILILRAAMDVNPEGAKAPYYLGCLFYDRLQFDEAISLWERSAKLDDTFPTVFRNLSIAYYNKRKDPDAALLMMEKAYRLDESDSQVFLELDQLHGRLHISPKERRKFLEAHLEHIEARDDIYTQYVTVLNLCGEHEKAYDAIMKHDFQNWEGAEGKITSQYKAALAALAGEDFEKKDYKEALKHLEAALSYPHNLGEGRLEGTKDNNLYYLKGLSEEKLCMEKEAETSFRKATEGASDPAGVMYYYDQPADMILCQGLAEEKLGNTGAANARFYKLIDYGEKHLRDEFKMDYFAVSLPDPSAYDEDMNIKNKAHCYYLMALGNLGLGNTDKARGFFDKVLKLDPDHQGAFTYRTLC